MPNPRLLFFGTSEFAIPALRELHGAGYTIVAVYTKLDQPAGRKQILTPPPVKQEAERQGLAVQQPDKLTKQMIEAHQSDCAVVAAYGKIIPSSVLDIPKHGFLNIHPSLLPKFRGPSPLQTAIAEGVATTGVSIMKLDSGMDTGPLLAQKEVEIEPEETANTLHDRCAHLGARLLLQCLPDYLDGRLAPQPQSTKSVSVTRILTKEDGKISWTDSAVSIERKIRAYTPWPGVWTAINGKRVKILRAEAMNISSYPREVALSGDAIIIGCGTGALRIVELQREGKKSMSADEFLRGIHDTFHVD